MRLWFLAHRMVSINQLIVENPFLVHVYTTSGIVKRQFINELNAIYFAKDQFNRDVVYKVKVWDLRIGKPVLNVQTHPALILHLV